MTGNDRDKQPLELYLHIPFCVRKCDYCDFLSGTADDCMQNRYMEALVTELKDRSKECREYEVQTVFIGGGTPSVVDAGWILRMMQVLRSFYQLAEDAEITMEMNPGTVDRDKLHNYRKAGINRLSIGLQSASDEELRKLGRIHTFEQFLKTYEDAVASGFTNINVDVMSALPGQTVESYAQTLEALMGLEPKPKHISAYSLIIEEGTPFYELWEQEKLDLPDEDSERRMYALTGDVLKANGFHRYEISNYAQDGYECRHNCGYWQRREYLGLGIGAASLMKECRFCNGQDLEAYIRHPLLQRQKLQELTPKERMEEFMFLGLRMTEGVSADVFCMTFGREITDVYGEVLRKNLEDGLLAVEVTDGREDAEVTCEGGRNVAGSMSRGAKAAFYHLTDRGMDVSNYVMAQFLF